MNVVEMLLEMGCSGSADDPVANPAPPASLPDDRSAVLSRAAFCLGKDVSHCYRWISCAHHVLVGHDDTGERACSEALEETERAREVERAYRR